MRVICTFAPGTDVMTLQASVPGDKALLRRMLAGQSVTKIVPTTDSDWTLHFGPASAKQATVKYKRSNSPQGE